jgi:hypothetical protein
MIDKPSRCVGGLGATATRFRDLTETIFHEALHYCSSDFAVDKKLGHRPEVNDSAVYKVIHACRMP